MAGRPKNRYPIEGKYTSGEVCKLLGISKRSLTRKAELEGWAREQDEQGNWWYDRDEIDALVGVPASLEKADLLDIFSATIESQNKHIHDLIKLVHKPAADFIEAQSQELERARGRLQEYEVMIGELHGMYGELMRTMAMHEAETKREIQSIQMREQAFEMLKSQLFPVMLEKIKDSSLLKSLTTPQIEALVTIHKESPNDSILSNEQASILEKELARREKGKDNDREQRSEDGSEDGSEEGKEADSDGVSKGNVRGRGK